MIINLSPLPHLWLIDIDGTILVHNGHIERHDSILPGVIDFWKTIPQEDFIVLLTARHESERDTTLEIFTNNGLRFNNSLFGLPTGERVLINDKKPSGLNTAHAINVLRNQGLNEIKIHINKDI